LQISTLEVTKMKKYTETEVLQFIQEHPEILSECIKDGSIDMDSVQIKMMHDEKVKTVAKYIDRIKQLNGKDRRYYIHLPDPTKKEGRIKLKAKTKDELIDKIYNWHVQKETNKRRYDDNITIREMYPIWLSQQKQTYEASTIISIESKWRNNIEPCRELVDTPIKLLNIDIIKTWAMDLLNGTDGKPGCKVKHYYNVKAIVNEILDKAQQCGIITINVARNTKIDVKSRKMKEMVEQKDEEDDDEVDDIITLTDDELQKFETAARELIDNKPIEQSLTILMLLFARQVGVRIGELLELQHKDVKEDGLHVRRFYAYTEDTTDPKTGERNHVIKRWLKGYKISRIIPLTDEALAILEEVNCIKAKHGIKTKHIFSINEHPVDYNYANRMMKKVCQKAHLQDHRLYVFRKTWITAMVDHSDLTLAQIAKMAGNTPAVIMKAYYGSREGLPDAATISAALKGKSK